jgi:hypothetical protein
MLNLRGREDEISEEREREMLRFVEVRVDMRVSGRERDVRIAAVVLSIDVSAAKNWRRGEESDVEVERYVP